MSNRVYTYTKITELKQAHYFAEIAALPQIVMSLDMATNMAYDMRIFRNNIMGFSAFQKRLFPGWNTSGQRFAYATVLNQFLREKIASAKDKAEREWLFGCKKNLYPAISNMIRLEEAGVRPGDIENPDRDLRLFVMMWKILETCDDTIREFRARVKELSQPGVFETEVNKIFRFHGKKKIVWHGFQFLTPMQQFVYDCFTACGYEIYALIQDDERYPYANEIWNHLYTLENGFPEKEHWIRQKDEGGKNPLGEIFETGERTTAPNLKMIRYRNTVEFVEDISRIKEEGYYLYCSDDKAANRLLKDYFPERYEVRNLLAYPIGQFIYTLHKMWDENLQCIVLSQTGLRKCFASGWLCVNGKSSANYTDELERLLPYFDGCYTVEEWNERLNHFVDAYENAVDVFASTPSGDGGKDRNREILGNPFHFFGVFSIKEERLDDVIAIIRQLIEMAKILFGKNEPISIYEHMSKLDSMLEMQEGMPQELYLEEREKVKRIFAALESEKVRDFLCYPGDLAAALLSFMGDKAEDDENKFELKTLVFEIFQVEAAPLAAKGKVHLCLADITKLPGATGKYAWPLDEGFLQNMRDAGKGTYLSNMLENNRLSALSNRYYVYAALKNECVEISWIQKQGEKIFSPSPYITLLDKLTDAQICESEIRKLDLQTVSEIEEKQHLETQYHIRDGQGHWQYDCELEYALCPMRFVYSYVLSDMPTYRNEYQQNRAMIRLIQSLAKLLAGKYSIEQVAGQVFELFPNIRKAEKRQMIDDAIRWPLPEKDDEHTEYEDRNYTNYRWNLVFPDEESFSCAKKEALMLMSKEGRRGIYHVRRGANGSKNCELCPHAGYCMQSLFGVDYRGEQL